jgi:tetratricopeptide (TPR) repeat protein
VLCKPQEQPDAEGYINLYSEAGIGYLTRLPTGVFGAVDDGRSIGILRACEKVLKPITTEGIVCENLETILNYIYAYMAKFSIKMIFSRLHHDARDKSNWRHILDLYDKGAFREAYDALYDLMKNAPPWSKKGDIYTLWAELELLANDDASQALQLLGKACELGYSEIGYYYKTLGQAMWKTGNHEMAVQYLEKSVEEEPNVANLTDLGQVLWHISDMRAMSIWQRVLEKDPKNCLAHIYIGLEAAKSGDRGKAILMAKRSERLQSSANDIYAIGTLYHNVDDFKSALNTYLKANRMGYTDKGQLYASIAACYISLGEQKMAHKYAQWAMQFDQENDYVKEVWQDVQKIQQDS